MKRLFIFMIVVSTFGSLSQFQILASEIAEQAALTEQRHNPSTQLQIPQATAETTQAKLAEEAAAAAKARDPFGIGADAKKNAEFKSAINNKNIPTHEQVAQLNNLLGGKLKLQDQANVASAIDAAKSGEFKSLKNLDTLLTSLANKYKPNATFNSKDFFANLEKQNSLSSTLNYFKLQLSHAVNATNPKGAVINLNDVKNSLESPFFGVITRKPINESAELAQINNSTVAHIIDTTSPVANTVKASIDTKTGVITNINSTASSADIITALSNLITTKYRIDINRADQKALEAILTNARTLNNDPSTNSSI